MSLYEECMQSIWEAEKRWNVIEPFIALLRSIKLGIDLDVRG